MSDDPDTRVTCTTCGNRQPVRGAMACTQPKRAGLIVPRSATYLELSRDLATQPQHCPAYTPAKERPHASARG